jgi:hypothetical protein
VECLNLPAVGETVTVTVVLPDGHLLEAAAEVTYSFSAMGFGARFVSLPDGDRKVLTDNLARLLA